MAVSAHTISQHPRRMLRGGDASTTVLTTEQVIDFLSDKPERKRRGALRAILVRGLPKFDAGYSPVAA